MKMAKGQKRDRNVNFTREETDQLITLVAAWKSIIENKKSDADTWQEKENAWKKVEEEFNCCGVSSVYRDARHLKVKYEALKRDVRKKEKEYNGGVLMLTPLEEKVRTMILSQVQSQNNSESLYDSDQSATQENFAMKNESNGEFTEILDMSSIPDPIAIDEPLTKRRCLDKEQPILSPSQVVETVETQPSINNKTSNDHEPQPSTSHVDESVDTQEIWAEWKPWAFKNRNNTDLSKSRARTPFEKLAGEKMHVVSIQKQLVREEIHEMRIKKLILQEQLQHNRELHELHKQEMLLKIELLKAKLKDSQSLSEIS